jgi:hypothetical protein
MGSIGKAEAFEAALMQIGVRDARGPGLQKAVGYMGASTR